MLVDVGRLEGSALRAAAQLRFPRAAWPRALQGAARGSSADGDGFGNALQTCARILLKIRADTVPCSRVTSEPRD